MPPEQVPAEQPMPEQTPPPTGGTVSTGSCKSAISKCHAESYAGSISGYSQYGLPPGWVVWYHVLDWIEWHTRGVAMITIDDINDAFNVAQVEANRIVNEALKKYLAPEVERAGLILWTELLE